MWKDLTWQHWALRGLLVVSILGLVAFVALNLWADRKMASVVATIKAQGISLEPADLRTVLDRDEANGSHVLGAACHLMALVASDPEVARWHEVSLVEAVSDGAVVEQARAWLERPTYRLVLETLDLHTTTRRASASASDQYANECGIPALGLRSLFRARALTRMAAGHSDAAYADAAMLLRVTYWLQMESPSVISWIIGNAMATSGLELMEQLLLIKPPSVESRALLRAELRRLDERRPSLGLEADLVMHHQQILRGSLGAQVDTSSSLKKAVNGVFQSWTQTAYHAYWLEGYSDLIGWSRMPAHQRPSLDPLMNDDSPFLIPVKFLIPNLRDSLDKTDAVRTRYRLAFLALAWEDYRDTHGVYPSTPEDLVPNFLNALPEDEMMGKPFFWRRDEGWLVYGVGVNQKDDGGVDQGTPQSGDEDDILWRLPPHTGT